MNEVHYVLDADWYVPFHIFLPVDTYTMDLR